MNGIRYPFWILAALALLAAHPAFGVDQGTTPPKATRATGPSVEGLKRGAQWENQGTAYAVVPEVRAVTSNDKNEEPSAALARHGVTGGTVIERKGGFILYRQSAPPQPLAGSTAPAPLLATKAAERPVALNLRTQKLAVVLNSIRAELKDTTAAEALASDMGITLGKQFPNRPVAYFTVPAGMDMIALVAKMRSDPRVAKADIELSEYTRTLH